VVHGGGSLAALNSAQLGPGAPARRVVGGRDVPAACTANGKAILAEIPRTLGTDGR
jgi:DNA-binding IclR family transcriptional regulator